MTQCETVAVVRSVQLERSKLLGSTGAAEVAEEKNTTHEHQSPCMHRSPPL